MLLRARQLSSIVFRTQRSVVRQEIARRRCHRARLFVSGIGALDFINTLDYKSHFEEKDRAYSHLSATIGSTFVARRAGIQQASSATTVSSSAITMNVNGSVALTPNSNVFINRVSAYDAVSPIATPTRDNIIPCLTTSFITSRVCAPSAIRSPISCVRCDTP